MYMFDSNILSRIAQDTQPDGIGIYSNINRVGADSFRPVKSHLKFYGELSEGSCIPDDLIDLNAKIISSEKARELLENPASIPFGGECLYFPCSLNPTLDFHIKPEVPRIAKNSRPIKYEVKLGGRQQARFLDYGIDRSIEILKPYCEPEALEILRSDYSPKAFWDLIAKCKAIPLVITEGHKKSLALMGLGKVVICLPSLSGSHQTSKQIKKENTKLAAAKAPLLNEIDKLAESLQRFEWKGRKIVLAFDNENPETKRGAYRAVALTTNKLITKFNYLGASVSVAQWKGYKAKGIDDLLVEVGANVVDWILETGISGAKFRSIVELDINTMWMPCSNKDKFFIDLNQRYLEPSNFDDLFATYNLIAAKSEKNTGKTYAYLKPAVERYHSEGYAVLYISLRRSLNEQARKDTRSFKKHVVEVDGKEEVYVEDFFSLSVAGKHHQLDTIKDAALCIDSLLKKSAARFDLDAWNGKFVIICDEFTQLLTHAVSANSIRDRGTILYNFAKLTQQCVRGGGKILIADADMSKLAFKTLTNWIELDSEAKSLVKPVLVQNFYRHKSTQCIYFNKANELYDAILEAIDAGNRVIVHTSSQRKESGKFATVLFEAAINELMGWKEGAHVLRIDKNSLSEKGHPACGCVAKLNDEEFMKQYHVVLASPSINTGISIDLKNEDGSGWFDIKVVYDSGVLSVDSFCQSGDRARNTNLLWIFAKGESRMGLVAKGAIYPSQYDAFYRNQTESIRLAGDAVAEEDWRVHTALSRIPKQDVTDDAAIANIAINYRREISIHQNIGKSEYAQAIVDRRKLGGDDVRSSADGYGTNRLRINAAKRIDEGEIAKETRKKLYTEILQAEVIDKEEYETINAKKRAASEPMEREITNKWERYKLARLLPEGEAVTMALCEIVNKFGVWAQCTDRYFMLMSAKDRLTRSNKILNNAAENRGIYDHDFVRRSTVPRFAVTDKLGIPALIKEANELGYISKATLDALRDRIRKHDQRKHPIVKALDMYFNLKWSTVNKLATPQAKNRAILNKLLQPAGYKVFKEPNDIRKPDIGYRLKDETLFESSQEDDGFLSLAERIAVIKNEDWQESLLREKANKAKATEDRARDVWFDLLKVQRQLNAKAYDERKAPSDPELEWKEIPF